MHVGEYNFGVVQFPRGNCFERVYCLTLLVIHQCFCTLCFLSRIKHTVSHPKTTHRIGMAPKHIKHEALGTILDRQKNRLRKVYISTRGQLNRVPYVRDSITPGSYFELSSGPYAPMSRVQFFQLSDSQAIRTEKFPICRMIPSYQP